MRVDSVVAGAGFAGCVIAERLASVCKQRVLVVETRNHIGGNAYDEYDTHGILVHRYGPHIFHTNSPEVFHYLSQFTEWISYQHRVLSYVDGQLVPFPVNLDTVNLLYGTQFNSDGLKAFFQEQRVTVPRIENSEQAVVSQVGFDLYEKFFKGYTTKQWGVEPSRLNPSVCRRIPIRDNRDSRYFTDKFQAIPKHGYTAMFRNMLNRPGVHLLLQTDFRELQSTVQYNHLYFTGPIDAYFHQKHGSLPYRSLRFQFEYFNQSRKQTVGTINYPNDYEFTRITEMKHITGQEHRGTTLVTEYPAGQGDPYYPVPAEESQAVYQLYKAEAEGLRNVTFAGRLGTYRYYNMDQVVGQALSLVTRREQLSV